MPFDVFLALVAFALVASITPGPNSMMLLASGVNFGFRRTIPHMCGIGLGFIALVLSIGLGLGKVFEFFPIVQVALKIVGGAYLLYLAWRIATASGVGTGDKAKAQPLTVLQAALFQWVNPKAWIMVISATAIYSNAETPNLSAILIASAFALVIVPSVTTWAGFGTAVSGFLGTPKRMRVFNVTMGILLVASMIPMVR